MSNQLPNTIFYPDTFLRLSTPWMDGVWDWSWTDGCFGEYRISPMDFDGIVERKGNFLLFETKDEGKDVPVGQMRTFKAAFALRCFTVIFIEGKTNPQYFMAWCAPGFKGGFIMQRKESIPDTKRLHDLCADWFEFANKNPTNPEKAYTDIEWFDERAGILEFEAGYSREESELIAIKMMTERRLQMDAIAEGGGE